MRSCIFCNNPASTKEDAWPQWLMRLFPESPMGEISAEQNGKKLTSWKTTKPELKIKCVCANCNNGWMSQLENRSKPIIQALMSENTVTLNTNDQIVLTTWSVKNAMVFESLRYEQLKFFTESERKLLMQTLQPPPWTTVWIAKCVDYKGVFCKGNDLGMMNEQTKCHIITMGFGSLAIQIRSIKLPGSIPFNTQITSDLRPGSWEQIALQIWPNRQDLIIWPASIGLSGEFGLETFAQRWNPNR